MGKRLILVLTADAGFGHRSAANAVFSALQERYSEEFDALLLNPLEDKRTPFFLRDSGADYDRLVRNMPELYKFSYSASDTGGISVLMESTLILTLYEIMRDLVRRYQPDAILTTYPLYQAPLDAVMNLGNFNIPMLTTITDLATVHRIWFSKAVERLLVPNEIVRDLAIGYGLKEDQVVVTGIPVNPLLSRKEEQDGLRRKLGWKPEMPTLLAVGSKRVERLAETLNVINHFGFPLQLAIVTGRDETLYSQLSQVEWHVPVHLYDFVQNIPEMMHASDAVVCKAGGLIVTESLAAGKPLMLIDVLPGQERGNAELVVNSGAGDLAETDLDVLQTLAHWLADDGKLLRMRASCANALGKPMAAYEAAEQTVQAARKGPSPHKHLWSRRTLIDLFNRNQVSWRDSRDGKETAS